MTAKLFISMILAMAVALLASRINRAPAIETPREPVLEEIIGEVEIDTRTFERAVNSLAKKTSAKLAIDPGLLSALQVEEAGRQREEPRRPQRFSNVPLGVLIARLLDQWGDELPVDWRVEGRTITFFRPPAEPAVERRVYDLRFFTTDWKQWRKLADSWEPPIPSGGGGGLFGGGGVGARHYESDDDLAANALTGVFQDNFAHKRSEEFKVIATWAGWVTIEASTNLHDSFANYLAIWAHASSIGAPK